MPRLKATLHVEIEYQADPDWYGTNDVDKMIVVDTENARCDPQALFFDFPSDTRTTDITIEVIELT